MKKEPTWKCGYFIFALSGCKDKIYDDIDEYWSMIYKDQCRSKMGIAEGQEHPVVLVKHNIGHGFHGKPDVDLVDVERTPVQSLLLIEILMTLLYHIRCHICVQVVDVVVFYPIGEGLQKQWDLQVRTSLQSCPVEIPFTFTLPIWHVDWVLQVEENRSKGHREVNTQVEF